MNRNPVCNDRLTISSDIITVIPVIIGVMCPALPGVILKAPAISPARIGQCGKC